MISGTVLDKLEYGKILENISRYTNTENGKNIILALQPLDNLEEIIKQGRYVTEAKEILIKKDIPPIDYLPDLNESLALSTIEGTALDSKVINEILKLAVISRKLFQYLSDEEAYGEIKRDLASDLFVDKVFEKHISSVFDEFGQIRDNATPELKRIRKDIRDKEEYLKKVVGKILKG
jgi:DNA mismatch repair protein MutS2